MRGRFVLSLAVLLGAAAQAAKTLDVYFIDVEGGQSTLVVSPSGQSLLIDAGSAGFSGRDADRIAAAAKAGGVKRIDFLLITSFQKDHVGGVPNLLERLPVGMFLDAGSSAPYPDSYQAAIAKGVHRVVSAGEMVPIKGLDVTVVTSAGRRIERPGEQNPHCAGIQSRAETGKDEDAQAAGVIVELGKFRFGDFGDLGWNQELDLLCPQNRAGKLDVYLTTRHGGESPKAIWGLATRVAVMNNAARRGGEAAGWKLIQQSPGLEDLWQLHFAVAGGKETNVPDPLIANVDENCAGRYIKVSASADGAFTVLNSRNKYMKMYSPRRTE